MTRMSTGTASTSRVASNLWRIPGASHFRHVHEHVRGKLAYPFKNAENRRSRDIAAPIWIYSLGPEIIAGLPRDDARSELPKKSWRWYVAALALGCMCSAALWTLWQYLGPSRETAAIETRSLGPSSPPASVPRALPLSAPAHSIVVLSFTSSDPEQEYFAEGITEDLTTDLSHSRFICHRAKHRLELQGKAYRCSADRPRIVGALCAARQRAPDCRNSVRINAQLVDAANASQLWADRFNGDVAQLAKVQDQVTQRIAAALHVALIDAESQRALRERPINPKVIDLTMRGSALLNKQASRESTQRARELFEAALRLSSDHPPALNGLAQTMLVQWQSTWYPRSSEEHLDELDRVMNKALAVNPDDAIATYHRGYVLKRLRKDLTGALAAFERAIAIDPNLAESHNYVGQIKVFLGRASEAAEHTLKAIQLSPRDPQLALWYYQLALTYIHQQRYDEAVWNGGGAACRSIRTYAIPIEFLRLLLPCRDRLMRPN